MARRVFEPGAPLTLLVGKQPEKGVPAAEDEMRVVMHGDSLAHTPPSSTPASWMSLVSSRRIGSNQSRWEAKSRALTP